MRSRVRIGVNTGEVVAGDPIAGQTLVTGDAVNVAARLEQAAPSPARSSSGALDIPARPDAVAPRRSSRSTLKGKADPVPAYRLMAVPLTPGADARRRSSGHRLVGRERGARRACQGHVRRTSPIGAAAARRRSWARPGWERPDSSRSSRASSKSRTRRSCRGRCLPYGDGITFWPDPRDRAEAAGFSDRDDAGLCAIARSCALLSDAAPIGQLVSERDLSGLGCPSNRRLDDELFWAIRRFC